MGCTTAQAADAKYDWDRLDRIQKIAIVAPFFCTEQATPKPAAETERDYQKKRQTLLLAMRKTLARRMTEQQRFRALPLDKTESGLKTAHWTACDLFARQAALDGKTWPIPDTARIAALARRLKVDAILIGTMRDPASIGDGFQIHHETWNVNPLNLSLKRIRSHVVSPRCQAFLVTASGEIAWKDEQMADHPRTNPRTDKTLWIDWQEATEQVAQQLADSLLRMPPPEQPEQHGPRRLSAANERK